VWAAWLTASATPRALAAASKHLAAVGGSGVVATALAATFRLAHLLASRLLLAVLLWSTIPAPFTEVSCNCFALLWRGIF